MEGVEDEEKMEWEVGEEPVVRREGGRLASDEKGWEIQLREAIWKEK